MALVVLTPLITALLHHKWVAWVSLAALFACQGQDIWWVRAPLIEATSFFVLGGFLARSRIGLFALDALAVPLLLAYPIVLVADAATANDSVGWLNKLDITLGVPAFLCLSAIAHRLGPVRRLLLALSPASFFVYAAHEPLLMLSRKMAYKLLAPDSDWVALGLYFAVPVTVIWVLLALRRGLMRTVPAFLRVITGGR